MGWKRLWHSGRKGSPALEEAIEAEHRRRQQQETWWTGYRRPSFQDLERV